MKKLIIAGVGTAVLGVVVAGASVSAVDKVQVGASVNVKGSCSMRIGGELVGDGATHTINMESVAGGSSREAYGQEMSITCNKGGWHLDAMGVDETGNVANTNLTGDATAGGATIATGTSGSDSYWAMRVETNDYATVANGFGSSNYHVVPSSNLTVAGYETYTTSAATVKPQYKVYIAGTQAAGTYTGRVRYTLVAPN